MTSSEQARADAMADAETLWRNTESYYDHAFLAARAGQWIQLSLAGDYRAAHVIPHQFAQVAANEAFLAVPGLRGE